MGFRHATETYLCFLQITSLHTDKQPSSFCKETHDQVCDQFIRCSGPQAEWLYFLKHFITFIKSMHYILVPGYDSGRIKYLTKVACDNENIIRRGTVQRREGASREEVRPKNPRYSFSQLSVSLLPLICCLALLLCHRNDALHLTCVFLFRLF